MLLTYKIKHYRDLDQELIKARLIAQFALETKSRSSKDVKDIGLPSAISNQILKKYSNNKTIKRIRKVVLTVPGQGIKADKDNHIITITCLKLKLAYFFANSFSKINQIELDHTYAYVTVFIEERAQIEASSYVGVDLNTLGHCAVMADPLTGKVLKLGKKAAHIRAKYANQRRHQQKKGNYKKLKKTKDKERRITKDMLHKVSRALVDYAYEHKVGIKLEKLKGIRKRKTAHSFKHFLNSWAYYKLDSYIEYKSKLLGVPVMYIDPRYTSKDCSKCQQRSNRHKKVFKCRECGHVDHADVNAAFNIALRH